MAEKNSEEIDAAVFANPLKDEIDPTKSARIQSIDLVKGFAMVFILIAHTSGAWLDDYWMFLHGEVYAVLHVLGPSLFIFLLNNSLAGRCCFCAPGYFHLYRL